MSGSVWLPCGWLACGWLATIGAAGCTSQPVAHSGENVRSGPSLVEPDHTPRDVAQMLLDRLDSSDRAELRLLVASEEVRADVERTTRGRRRLDWLVENAESTTVSGWIVTHGFLKPGTAVIDTVAITGERAVVTATAQHHDGSLTTLIINLVREEGLWKVAPDFHQE